MIHTMDFVYDLQRDVDTRKSVLCWLEVPDGDPITVGQFRLEWISGVAEVQISLLNQSYPFHWKCPEYQCPAGELAELIRALCEKV